jgi:hypothetical protein
MRDRVQLSVLAFAVLFLVGARPASAFHFEKESEDTHRLIPQSQQGEPGGPQTSVAGDLSVEFATFETIFIQEIDCSASCDEAGCSTTPNNVVCTNLATGTFMIQPDPGELPGTPVSVCVSDEYNLSATSTGVYSGYSAVGGTPTVIVDPTLVKLNTSVAFSNGPVQITSGTAFDFLRDRFVAHVGDTIEVHLGTDVQGGGTGIGSFHGVTHAELRVYSCPSTAPAPALSRSALGALFMMLLGGGVYGIRRRSVR